jgi:glycosyltransferase involved in cell wall biosynthesis
MPAYNHEHFVEEAIRSIWAQTYTNVELIVLDDGSKDRTPHLVKQLLTESPIPMRAICKPNEGLTRTLNRALKLAEGEYIALSSGDDRYLPRHVETLVQAGLQAPPRTVAYGDAYIIDENGARTGARLSDGDHFRDGMVFEHVLLLEFILPGLVTLFPADALRQGGGYNEQSLLDDWEMFLRITRKHPVRYVPECLAEYRAHDGQLSRQTAVLVPDMIRIFAENIRDYPRADNRSWARYAWSRLYLKLGHYFYNVREFRQARYWFVRSIFRYPFQPEAIKLFVRSLLGARLVTWVSARRARRRASEATAG